MLLLPSSRCSSVVEKVFCLHGGLSPSIETLDHIRALDRVQEVRLISGGELSSRPNMDRLL